MKSLIRNVSQHLSCIFSPKGARKMLCVNLKKISLMAILLFVCSSILFATDSFAAEATKPLFNDLAEHGGRIFSGMREIIYAVSGIGIIAIVIGSIFGNINWKWLTAIIIGLFVIACTAAIINYMVGDTTITTEMITDSLKTGK